MTKIDFQNLRSKKIWDFFLRKTNNFSELRNFRWKNIFQKKSKFSIFRKIFWKIFFHRKFRSSEKLFFSTKKYQFFFDLKFWKSIFVMKKWIFFFRNFLFERYGCVDSISDLYAVKRCLLQEGSAGECEKLGNLSSS